MERRPMAYCIACDEDVEYTVHADRVETVIRGTTISYIELSAKCPICGDEIYVPEVNDTNVQAREEAYRVAMHLITVEEIQEILEKYNIGAGPLAKILGVGDITINRYLLGQLPSREMSEKLYSIRSNRKLMRNYLDSNKDKITFIAYEKCNEALNQLDQKLGDSKIDIVTRYLLSKNFDITPLALQKLLYYAQNFFHALFGNYLFVDKCQAWSHGPVYPDVYYRYRECHGEPIPYLRDDMDFSILSAKEKNFLDAVLSVFGFYSGGVLSDITHMETPWLEARGNLRPEDRCTNVIDQNTLHEYFDGVVKQYNIVTPRDMEKYCSEMLK